MGIIAAMARKVLSIVAGLAVVTPAPAFAGEDWTRSTIDCQVQAPSGATNVLVDCPQESFPLAEPDVPSIRPIRGT